MTRKDYINIAGAIIAVQARIKNEFEEKELSGARNPHFDVKELNAHRDSQLRGVRRTAAHLADFLKDDNPAGFDPVLFLKNCGYGYGGEVVTDEQSRRAWAQREEPDYERRADG